MKILVVDDHPVSLILLNHQLIVMGFSVLQANSVEQAVVLLHQEPIDVVIMDCQMLGIDGIKFTTLIRNQNNLAGLAQRIIIGVVPSDCSEIKLNELASCMDKLISKPIDIQELRTMLSTCLECMQFTSTERVKNNHIVLKIIKETTNKDLDMAFEYLNSAKLILLASSVHRIKGAYLMINDVEIVELCRKIENVLNRDKNIQHLTLLLTTLKNKVNI
ncbi:response regulator [Aeromonas popoffii]|uniref:response regulator n=1 Tax=Aeromonas popoffii TaxID=70856 RepID=UPI0005A7B612|nr:response regulator [Aeromonas popoffii]